MWKEKRKMLVIHILTVLITATFCKLVLLLVINIVVYCSLTNVKFFHHYSSPFFANRSQIISFLWLTSPASFFRILTVLLFFWLYMNPGTIFLCFPGHCQDVVVYEQPLFTYAHTNAAITNFTWQCVAPVASLSMPTPHILLPQCKNIS